MGSICHHHHRRLPAEILCGNASSVAYVWTYNNNNNHSFNNDDDNGVVGWFLVVYAGTLHFQFRGNSFQWKLSIKSVRFWHTTSLLVEIGCSHMVWHQSWHILTSDLMLNGRNRCNFTRRPIKRGLCWWMCFVPNIYPTLCNIK